MKFALICPTRGRPHRFTGMVLSALRTAAAPDEIAVYAVMDEDDPTQYETLAHVVTLTGARGLLSAAFQRGAEKALADGADVLMMVGDDCVFRTVAWDEKVLDCFARYRDGLALIYPADGNGNKGIHDNDVRGNHWFVTRKWVETVGCFVPGEFEHFCVDTVPERIAQQAGRLVHLPGVLVEHMHFKYLKSKKDDTYSHARVCDERGRSVSDRDIARMAGMAPWIAERAAAVRAAMR